MKKIFACIASPIGRGRAARSSALAPARIRVGPVSNRELVVLGTASQAPTRTRNHNGYFLRWDDEGLLFDPGEGTQRQMLFAGVTAHQVTRVCVTHFHGDHCLGLPGVLQRMAVDRVAGPVEVAYPASGADIFDRIRKLSLFHDTLSLRERPVPEDGAVLADGPAFRLEARPLSHRVPAVGYRLSEPDSRRMLPAELAARGIAGPDIGRLQRDGMIEQNGRWFHLAEVSAPRRGQKFAFIMDTCDAVFELADDADLLVCESTFADEDAALADDYGHLTAGQAGRIAAAAGARRLVLTHFSQRYDDLALPQLLRDAAAAYDGDIVLAADLDRVAVPPR
jgi:ribonuclease Z